MTNLPLEMQPDSALEERVTSAVVAAGLVRRRRVWSVWAAAAAAVVVLLVGITTFRPKHALAPGNTYAVLLYEDPAYKPSPPQVGNVRVQVLSRWADSLNAAGKYISAGRLTGPGPLGGLFMIRATDDADAARIAASCPFRQWGGHVEVKRYDR